MRKMLWYAAALGLAPLAGLWAGGSGVSAAQTSREFAHRTAPERACLAVSPSQTIDHQAQLDACKLAVVAAGKRAKAWTGNDRDEALLDVAAYYMTAAATDTYLGDPVGARYAIDKARMAYAFVEVRSKRPALRAAAASARMCLDDPDHCKTPKSVKGD
jgi:hypothetical protein